LPLNDALHVAEEGLREFPANHPELYMTLGDAYFEMGWVEEARSILNEGLRKFPGDEDIENILERIEDETDDPDKGRKPPIIGLLLLLSLIQIEPYTEEIWEEKVRKIEFKRHDIIEY